MDFKYVSFNENIFSQAVSRERSLYIAEDERAANLGRAEKCYAKLREPLSSASEFIKFGDLKEKLFAGEGITLREEKLSVVLYELMNEGEKRELGIENYNDIIEFSARFHRFYRELAEYRIRSQDLPEMEGWQQERFELIEDLKIRFCDFLKERGYAAPGFHFALAGDKDSCGSENISEMQEIEEEFLSSLKEMSWLKRFKRIVFLNTIFLTPLETWIIKALDSQMDLDVELYLQLEPASYQEDGMEIREFNLPDSLSCEVNLYQAAEDTLQLASALHLARPGESELLTPRLEEAGYQHIISADQVEMPRKKEFKASNIYQFIEALQQILGASPPGREEIALVELLDALGRDFFRDYFELTEKVPDQVRELLREDYLYLDRELAEKKAPELLELFAELSDIREVKRLPELVDYLDNLKMEALSSLDFSDDIDKFYDALLELNSLEEMGLVSSWKSYYRNPALGLLDRILQYLEYKRINFRERGQEADLKLEELMSAPEIARDHLMVLNCQQGWLPSISGGDFILTRAQREEVGLPVAEDERKKQRYHFLRHLFTAERVDLLTLENRDENETPGAFLEELSLHYGLEIEEAPLQEGNYPEFYRAVFGEEKGGLPLLLGDAAEIEKEEDPPVEADDFNSGDGEFSLGYYKYNELASCPFRFLVSQLMKLKPEMGKVERMLSPKTFGSMVHFMAEDLLEAGDLDEDFATIKASISGVIDKVLADFNLKIDHRFQDYYHRIMREELKESLEQFFTSLNSPLKDEGLTIDQWWVEYSPGSQKGKKKKPEAEKSQESGITVTEAAADLEQQGAKEDIISEDTLSDEEADGPFFESGLVNIYLSGRIDLLLDCGDRVILIDFKSGKINDDQLNFYAVLLKHCDQETRPIYKHFYQVMERKFYSEEPNSELEFRSELEEKLEDFIEEGRYTRNDSECYHCKYKKICRVGDKK